LTLPFFCHAFALPLFAICTLVICEQCCTLEHFDACSVPLQLDVWMEFIRPSANNVSRCFQGHKIPRPEERGTRSPEALLLHTSFLARKKLLSKESIEEKTACL
jgi:hypothetical protein